ncbi:carbohydrate ABC transporter permease [Microbacterium oxydans]|uniref:carbohydrate ABC transporter permease n=1 Tax=Microbacterium oxydans TaxID=82380 RepID=UPI00226B25B4|nr:sugar ABC transporter permease [Microbacterium oxydans]WAA66534.1 sugar ABC transporter permease [Microbacterium oxydans]
MTTTTAPRRSSRRTEEEPRGRRRQRTNAGFALALLTPALILLALFTLAPAIYALILSLMQRRISGGLLGGDSTLEFVGIENYVAAFLDSELWAGLGRMLIVAGIGVPGTIILAALFALCLDADRTRLIGVWRILIFLPYAVPGVIASLLWGFLYLPATSPIGGEVIDFFGGTEIFFSVANIAVWGVVGFNMVIMYTALRGLPQEMYEAAKLDGAGELQIALRIKLPLIRPAIVMCSLFSVLGALQLFNEPTTLRPLANAISSTWVPLMKVYTDAFVNDDIHRAAATSLLLVVLTVGASVLVNRVGILIGKKR